MRRAARSGRRSSSPSSNRNRPADHSHGVDVVAHEADAEARLLVKPFEQVEYLGLDADVEGGDWFVQEQKLRIERRCTCKAPALGLASTQPVRTTPQVQACRMERPLSFPPHRRNRLLRLPCDLCLPSVRNCVEIFPMGLDPETYRKRSGGNDAKVRSRCN